MPLLAKSTPISRYLVIPENNPGNLHKHVLDGLTADAMPKEQDSHEEMMAGWVPFETPFEPDFTKSSFSYGVDMAFSLRIDKKSLSAKIVERELAVAINNKRKETGRDFLSRSEKSELKEMVLDSLISQAPFTPAVHNICWNSNTNDLFFFGAPKAAKELFESLFFRSFKMKVVPVFPYSLAYFKLGSLSAVEKDKLATLSPLGVK